MNDENNESKDIEEIGDEAELEPSPLESPDPTPVPDLVEPLEVESDDPFADSESLVVDVTEDSESSFQALSSGTDDAPPELPPELPPMREAPYASPEAQEPEAQEPEVQEPIAATPTREAFAPPQGAADEDAPEVAPDLTEQEQRDADSLVLLGGFLGVLAIPVLIGTFFAGERHAMIVNVVSGAILLVIGVGLVLRGRHLLGGRLRGRFARRS